MKRKNANVMRKAAAAILTAAMTMSLLSGCTGGEESGTASDRTEQDAATEESSSEKASAGDNNASGGEVAADTELKTIRILGIDNSGTDDSGTTVYLSDWVNGDSKMWERLTSDLAERGVALELDLIPADQYDTVIQTQLAAGLDCDFVNLHGIDTKTRTSLISQGKLAAVNAIWEQYSEPETRAFYEEGNGSQVTKLNRIQRQIWRRQQMRRMKKFPS